MRALLMGLAVSFFTCGVNAQVAGDWSIAISSTTPEVTRWEGAVIELRIQNLLPASQKLKPVLSGESREQALGVTAPNGVRTELDSVVLLEGANEGGMYDELIAPADTYVRLIVAAFDWQRSRPLFDEPGEYTIDVKVGNSVSNLLAIRCKPVEPAQEEAFARLVALQDQNVLAPLYAGHLLNRMKYRAVRPELEAIAMSSAPGWQKDYAAYALGFWWSRKLDPELDSQELLDVATQANSWLARVAPSSPLTPISDARKLWVRETLASIQSEQ